ncbi:MAG TPA: YicC family protein [Bacteroides sp.]|nr:YicC family protein [Bacteroides sp.]
MLVSMTGYGRAECDLKNMVYSIEIKSLNSKQLDISVKVPVPLREKELEIRNMLNKNLHRGKVEIGIFYEVKESSSGYSVNQAVVKEYIKQLRQLAEDEEFDSNDRILQVAMRLPDAIRSEKEALEEEEWDLIKKAIGEAVEELVSFRQQEGRALEDDITLRVHSIQARLNQIEPFEEERIKKVRHRIQSALRDLQKDVQADQNRLEQEMIIYLEKMDITEEKVRLQNHCRFFIETIKDGPSAGKKLGFISQEMGREINTIGSKASDSDIQRLVVEMKDDLEKIKEQVLNVL